MEIKIAKKEKDYIEIELHGEDVDIGFPNAIKEILLEDENVEFAACRHDHPLIAPPVLMVRVKEGSPVSALKSAIKKLRKQAVEFKELAKSAKKTKK
ncbi:MAG: DNA-directed RNA polymerase subunit L [Candidatus Micrarchaeota archaeon]|nr:DNA-directed RNA polymerase subunit L [Candidatus Micrarchaeota archaeon]